MIRMHKQKRVIGVSIVLSIIVFASLVHAKTYRWVDKKGKVHYSEIIPPSEAQYGHDVLNAKNGMTINQVESSDIRKQRFKEEQLEKEKNLIKKKALREELMIYMFSSKQELVEYFEDRLKMISVNIRLLQYHQKKLRNTIAGMSKKIKGVKAEKLKAKLLTGLRDSQRSLTDHTRAIEANETERQEMNEQMARAMKTYDRKFGKTQLNVGSLIGSSVLDKFRGKSNRLPSSITSKAKGMCSCPCSAGN